MNRRQFLGGVGGALGAGLAGCVSSNAESLGPNEIGMSTRRFLPGKLTVEAGTTVTWRNTSSHGHTVTAYGDGIPPEAEFFASGDATSEAAAREAWRNGFGGLIEPGETYKHTFEVRGTHNYFCIPHEPSGMVGVVVVE